MGFNGDLYPTAGASVVMTTKGDMVDYDTERQRLGIGSTGQVLTVASSLPTWATLTTADSVLTTQGDVLYESASGLARLGFGTSGDVLTTKGTGANPVWETPSAGGATITRTTVNGATNDQTTTSTTLTDVSGTTSMTLTNVSGGGAFACFSWIGEGDVNTQRRVGIEIDGTDTGQTANFGEAGEISSVSVCVTAPTDGTVLQARWAIANGTGTLYNTAIRNSDMVVMEVS